LSYLLNVETVFVLLDYHGCFAEHESNLAISDRLVLVLETVVRGADYERRTILPEQPLEDASAFGQPYSGRPHDAGNDGYF
jgi:hypothetical protein